MNPQKNRSLSHWKQTRHFIIHLRWHYQVFILSGGFLLGGYLSENIHWPLFVLQFANVHLLLFGGATAYNSYCDQDEGSIGGLQFPPPVPAWMGVAGLSIQFIGLICALTAGWVFTLVYLASILLFWLYSSPHFRWKGRPLLSLVAIGISTGADALLMGYMAADIDAISSSVWIASAGVALILISLYPSSQLFQIDEDYRRGDETFAIHFGLPGVIYLFVVCFLGGLLLISLSVAMKWHGAGGIFLVMGMTTGVWIYRQLRMLRAEQTDYARIMRIKYISSFAFVSFIIILMVLDHAR